MVSWSGTQIRVDECAEWVYALLVPNDFEESRDEGCSEGIGCVELPTSHMGDLDGWR